MEFNLDDMDDRLIHLVNDAVQKHGNSLAKIVLVSSAFLSIFLFFD